MILTQCALIRESLGMSQRKLGKLVYLDKTLIQGYEAGESCPRCIAALIAKALHCLMCDLVTPLTEEDLAEIVYNYRFARAEKARKKSELAANQSQAALERLRSLEPPAPEPAPSWAKLALADCNSYINLGRRSSDGGEKSNA